MKRLILAVALIILAVPSYSADICAKQGATEVCITTTASLNTAAAGWKRIWNAQNPTLPQYADTVQGTIDFFAEQWLQPLLDDKEQGWKNILGGRYRGNIDDDDAAQISAKCVVQGLDADCE